MSLKVIENYTIQSGSHDFLLTFHSNHRPISHRFLDKRRFPSKMPIYPAARAFNAPVEGVPFGIGYRSKGQQAKMTGLPHGRISFESLRFSRLDTIPAVTDRQPRHRRSTYRTYRVARVKRSPADADNRLDAFSGQSRSTNVLPFHMLRIVSYCAIVTLSLRQYFYDILFLRYSSSKNFMTLKRGQRSLKVIESDIIR